MLVPNEPQPFSIDEIIADKYQILALTGHPDKGFSYKAKDLQAGQYVTVRAFKPIKNITDISKEKFLRRSKLLKSLEHPGIVSTKDFGVLDNGIFYSITECIEGCSLAYILKQEERLDFQVAFPIFRDICQALSFSHKQQIAHGAICPENILLVKDASGGYVTKLCNFRISLFARPRANQKVDPQFTEIFADPTYMSPEECQGLQINGSSDIYSLGCVMYKTLSGITTLLNQDGTKALVMQVCSRVQPLSRLVSLPDHLETLVMKAIEKFPNDRYHSADQLLKALEFTLAFYIDKQNLAALPVFEKWQKQLHLLIKHLLRRKFIGEMPEKIVPDFRHFSGYDPSQYYLERA